MKKLLLIAVLTCSSLLSSAQISIFSHPPLNGGNGLSGTAAGTGVTFNLRALTSVFIDTLYIPTYGTTLGAASTAQIWVGPPVTAQPTIQAPAWTQVQPSFPVTVQNTGSTAPATGFQWSPVVIPGGLLVNAGDLIGIFVGVTAGTSIAYTGTGTVPAGIDTFSNGLVTIYTGVGAGWSGNLPSPNITVRQFTGGVSMRPSSGRDLRLASLVSPNTIALGANSVILRAQNVAFDNITQADFGYQLNNDPPVINPSVPIFPAISAGQFFEHTMSTPLNITANGIYQLKVWANNASGLGADNNPSNDTLSFTLCTALSGTYSVGAGGDFAGVREAVNALQQCGVGGPVTFLINPGTYYGSYTMNNISGLSLINQVTFTSATGVAADVVLIQDTATGVTNRNIFTLNNLTGVNFSSLTFRRTQIQSSGVFANLNATNVDNLTVVSCAFEDLSPFNTNSNGIRIDNGSFALITGNTLSGFNNSIFLTGPTTNNGYEESNNISVNRIINYRNAISLTNQSLSTVESNEIQNALGVNTGYGISVSRVIGLNVRSNKITGTIGLGGILVTNPNDSVGMTNLVANNVISGTRVSTTSSSAFGINLTGSFSSTATAPVNPRDAIQVYHNTINLLVDMPSTAVYGLLNVTGGGTTTATPPAWNSISILNNQIVGSATGAGLGTSAVAALFANDSIVAVVTSNHNNFFLANASGLPAGNNLVRNSTGPVQFATVTAWNTATGNDAASFSLNPFFATINEPLPGVAALNDQGLPIASVTLDILGLPRSATTPDIGAYEFSPRALDAALMTAVGSVFGCSDDSATVTVKIGNFGTSIITSLSLGYTSSSGASSTVTLNNLNLAFGDTLLYSFPQRAILTMGLNTINTFVDLPGDLVLANDSGSFSVNKAPLVSAFPYFENWENGTGGWFAGGANSSWAYGTPNSTTINAAFSGSNAWVTNLTGSYNISELSFLQSPCFDLTGVVQPFVEFKLWWITETSFDGLNLQYSTDGGASWQVLGTVGSGILNWYTRASVSSSQNQPVWAGSAAAASPGYVTVRHSLNSLPANSSVIFRLRFSSDASIVFDGIAVDDFMISFPPPADMSVIAVTAPTSGCNGQVSDTVSIRLVNAGTVAQSNFPVSYVVNGGIPVTETFTATINPGDTMSYSFSTLIAGGLPVGANTITAYPSLNGDIIFNNDTVRRTINVFPSINTFPYVEGFENGNGGWTTGGNNSSWAWGAPNDVSTNNPALIGAYNGTNAWVTNLSGNYNNSEASWLMSPCFDLSSMQNVRLRFGLWYSTESSWDGGNLAYSIDGGNTWTVAGALGSAINWYNAASVSSSQTQPVWAGNGGGAWLPAEITLPQLANQASVRLRFQFFSDGSINAFSGIGVDSIRIELPTDPIVNAVTVATDSCINATRTITADITQFRQLTNVNLHYNITGTTTYTALPMTRVGTTSEWTATIPVSAPAVRNRYFVSAVDSLGLTDTSNVFSYLDNYLGLNVSPTTRTVNVGDTVILRATPSGVVNLKITEVVQFRTGAGATAPYPAFAVGQDLVEISNLSMGSADLSGYTFGVFGSGARTYTFPAGTILQGNSALILHIGSGTDSPSDRYYNTGGSNDAILSTSPVGYLLKDVGGQHVDAVATNGYTFPVAAGVSAAQWSGSIPNITGAGVIRVISDNNNASDWVVSNASTLMSVGALNPGMVLSTPGANIVWNTTPPVNGDTLVVGPFTTSGTFTYVATLSDGRCSTTDTAIIIVQAQLPDIGVTQIISNNTPRLNQPQAVTAVIRNFSSTTPATGFDVAFRVNGIEINAAAIGRTVAPLDTIHHTFALAWTPTTGGRHNLCAFTRFTDDPNLANDTTCVVYLGVNVESQEDLVHRVYPVPADNFVVFDFGTVQGVGTLEIRDQLGKLVRSQVLDLTTGATHEVNTANLAAGIYNYRFLLNEKVQHGQVIIRR